MAGTLDDSLRLSRSAKGIICRFLEQEQRDLDYFDERYREDIARGGNPIDPDQEAWGREYFGKARARTIAPFALMGLQSAATPWLALAEEDCEAAFAQLLGADQLPSIDVLENMLREYTSRHAAELSIHVEISRAFPRGAVGDGPDISNVLETYFKGIAGIEPSEPLTESTTEYAFKNSLGPVRIELIWRGPYIARIRVFARATVAAKDKLATAVPSVLRACLVVCQGYDGQRRSTSPLRRSPATAGESDAYVLHYGGHTLNRSCHWKLFEYLCSISLSPHLARSEGARARFNPESTLKSGIWILAHHDNNPFAPSALTSYLAVFQACLEALYSPKQQGESATHHAARVLQLDPLDETRLSQLFESRNDYVHNLDPRIAPLHSLQAWLLARFALYQLAVKLCPDGKPTDEVQLWLSGGQRQSHIRRGILCDYKQLLRLGCIGDPE